MQENIIITPSAAAQIHNAVPAIFLFLPVILSIAANPSIIVKSIAHKHFPYVLKTIRLLTRDISTVSRIVYPPAKSVIAPYSHRDNAPAMRAADAAAAAPMSSRAVIINASPTILIGRPKGSRYPASISLLSGPM